jgi:predicted membrane metal-binding protein
MAMKTLPIQRLKVSLRKRYPLLFIGMGILWGQSGAYFSLCTGSIWILISFGLLSAVSAFPNTRAICLSLFAFTVGVLSLLQTVSIVERSHPKKEYRALLKVISTPERKRVQQVSFGATVINSELGDIAVRCRATELPWLNISGVRKGDVLQALFVYEPLPEHFSPFSYFGLLFRRGYSGFCRIKEVAALWDKERPATWIENIRRSMPEHDPYRLQYGLLLSLILGIDSELSPQLENEFKKTGLTHLLVFSGAQTTIIYFMFGFLFRSCGAFFARYAPHRNIFLSLQILTLIATVLLVYGIGLQLSSVRALIACWLSSLGERFESNRGMLYRMFLSIVLLNLFWPMCLLEVGVQLTYAALFGIWIGMQFRNKIIGYGVMCFSIGLLTNFVTMLWFHSVSVMGFLLNPFLAPTVALLSVYGGIPALIGIVLKIPVMHELSILMFILLDYLEQFVHWASQFSWGYYQW